MKRFTVFPLAPAGPLRFLELIKICLFPAVLFVVTLGLLVAPWRFNYGFLANIVCFLVAVGIIAWPAIAFFIWAVGVIQVARESVARSSAVVFWMYWPFWRFFMCLVTLGLAVNIGNFLWYNNFRPYWAYKFMQGYQNVDAYTVTGTRFQDVGLVVFNETNGVDRARGGCVINGHTYCVAPLLRGGQVKPGVKQNKVAEQDIYMAGIDCCNCPMTDFRCGDWDSPNPLVGGMRVMDVEDRKMFRLAAEKFAANYDKVTLHSIFFHWVADPIQAWKDLYTKGLQLFILACVMATLLCFLLGVILNGLMKCLKDFSFAAPCDDSPPKLPGIGFGRERFGNIPWLEPEDKPFVPTMYQSYLHQQDLTEVDQDAKFVIL